MAEFQVRKLRAGDLAKGFFEALENLSPVGEINRQDAENILKRIDELPEYNVFVAVTDDGEVIGAGTLLVEQKFIRKMGKAGHIEDIVTRKGWEGKGIGSAIMHALEEEAKRQGCYKIILTTRSEKIAGWYKKFGYYTRGVELRKDLA